MPSQPPKPDQVVRAELDGHEPFYDEASGQWLVGDDPGFDPDGDDEAAGAEG